MCNIKPKRYIRYVLVSVFLIIALLISFVVISINNYDSNRIYNLRKVPKEYRISLMNKYFENIYKENSILLLGDSQANGHLFPTKYIYSSLLQERANINVLNFAFQDARIKDNIYVLKLSRDNNAKFRTVIFNANQAHVKENDFTQLDFNSSKEYEYGIFKELKSFMDFAINPNVKSKPKENLKLHKYDNYFDMENKKLNEYIEKLKELIYLAKKVSDKVVIYITPHSTSAVVFDNKENDRKLALFANSIKKTCSGLNVLCLEPDLKDDKYFFDIVHLNTNGHEKMYSELIPHLK